MQLCLQPSQYSVLFIGKTMHSIHALIVDLTLITIYAGITTLLFKWLKQPTVLGYILAGIFAGPFFNFVPTVSDNENLTLWADIGVIFLLFGLGLEFSFKKMISVGKSAMITALLNIVLMLFAGFYTGKLLGWPVMDCFFLGSMISMSSTTIIIKAFDDLNVKKQRFTDLVFGVLVVEDIVGILLLVLLPMIALGSDINSEALALSTVKLIFFLVLCFIIGIFLVPTFLRKITVFLNDEMLLLITICLCFGMVLLATYSGFSSALGAFIMGSILAETGLIERIENNIKPLKDFFGAVFFVSVGMMVDPSMFITYAWPIFFITVIVVTGKVIFSCAGFVISGQPLKTAVQGGFSLAQVGEFAFIIASLGMSIGVLSDKVYPIIVAVSVITTFLTPMMIKAAPKFYKSVTRFFPDSWNKYIEENTSSRPETKREEQLWRLLFKNYFARLILFSMILYSIFALASYVVEPFLLRFLPDWPFRIAITLLTLGAMSPFLKALIGWETVLPGYIKSKVSDVFCRLSALSREHPTGTAVIKNIEDKALSCLGGEENFESVKNFFISNNKVAVIYYKLWHDKKSNRIPLIILTVVRLLVISLFVFAVVHRFLTTNPQVTALLVLGTLFLFSQSRWLLHQYMKIENQFLDNLNGEKKSSSEDKNE